MVKSYEEKTMALAQDCIYLYFRRLCFDRNPDILLFHDTGYQSEDERKCNI